MNLSTPSTPTNSRDERKDSLDYSEYSNDNGHSQSNRVGINPPPNGTNESNHQTYKAEEIIHVPNLGQVRNCRSVHLCTDCMIHFLHTVF